MYGAGNVLAGHETGRHPLRLDRLLRPHMEETRYMYIEMERAIDLWRFERSLHAHCIGACYGRCITVLSCSCVHLSLLSLPFLATCKPPSFLSVLRRH
jgi:hypothetical protein